MNQKAKLTEYLKSMYKTHLKVKEIVMTCYSLVHRQGFGLLLGALFGLSSAVTFAQILPTTPQANATQVVVGAAQMSAYLP